MERKPNIKLDEAIDRKTSNTSDQNFKSKVNIEIKTNPKSPSSSKLQPIDILQKKNGVVDINNLNNTNNLNNLNNINNINNISNVEMNYNSSSEESSSEGFESDSDKGTGESTLPKRKGPAPRLKPNLTRDQIVVVKNIKNNIFKNCTCLPDVPRPILPPVSGKMNPEKFQMIQEFISAFEYNFLSEFFFDINKRKPFHKIMDTCKEIIKDSLPIRCVEGTLLAIYLTQNFDNILRYPISFRSYVGDTSYKHIILCVQRGHLFGALGISRKQNLMYKPLEFTSLGALIQNFWNAYQEIGHKVLGFTIGLPIPNNLPAKDTISWEFLQLSMNKHSKEDIISILDMYSKESLKLSEEAKSSSGLTQKSKKTYSGFLIPKYGRLGRSVPEQNKKTEKNIPHNKLKEIKEIKK